MSVAGGRGRSAAPRARRKHYWIYVAELVPTLPRRQRKRIDELNPQSGQNGPALLVGYTVTERPEHRFPPRAGGGHDFSKARRPILKKLGSLLLPTEDWKRLAPGIRKRHTKREGALTGCERLIEALRYAGYQVANPPPEPKYSVYVIRLNDPVSETDNRDQNARHSSARPRVYVGQTSLDPEDRLRQHREGLHSGRGFNAEDIIGLAPDLMPQRLMTELESLREERSLAEKLRRKGYVVLGGH